MSTKVRALNNHITHLVKRLSPPAKRMILLPTIMLISLLFVICPFRLMLFSFIIIMLMKQFKPYLLWSWIRDMMGSLMILRITTSLQTEQLPIHLFKWTVLQRSTPTCQRVFAILFLWRIRYQISHYERQKKQDQVLTIYKSK